MPHLLQAVYSVVVLEVYAGADGSVFAFGGEKDEGYAGGAGVSAECGNDGVAFEFEDATGSGKWWKVFCQ